MLSPCNPIPINTTSEYPALPGQNRGGRGFVSLMSCGQGLTYLLFTGIRWGI